MGAGDVAFRGFNGALLTSLHLAEHSASNCAVCRFPFAIVTPTRSETPLEVLDAQRIVAGGRRGSSRPILVETTGGRRLVKLRGAAQGTGPLIAEIIVGTLAQAIGLSVPGRCLVRLRPGIETVDGDDELADLVGASAGINLGVDYLDDAQEIVASDVASIPLATQARILWLDRLVLNSDRTGRNSNLLKWRRHLWLIDHGASLPFQYDWASVTEDLPGQPGWMREAHLFEASVPNALLWETDLALGALLSRDVVGCAASLVPDEFLHTLDASQRRRRRAAFAAFLWKRLRSPRPFLGERALPVHRPGAKPAWVRRSPP